MAVLAPAGRDAALVAQALDGVDVGVLPAGSPRELAALLGRDDIGAVVVTQEALGMPEVEAVGAALAGEPDWSDVPFVLFGDSGWGTREYLATMNLLGATRNLTVLDRPVRLVAFRSVVALAVQGRRQQLAVRDLLHEVGTLNGQLHRRVAEQTVALRNRAERIEALARAVSSAERHERERISQLLHDDVQQILFGLRIQIGLIDGADGVNREAADRSEEYVVEAMDKVRELAFDLHTITVPAGGVAEALEAVADTARERYGIAVHLDVDEGMTVNDALVLEALTRVAREGLLNVAKHAGTGEAWVRAWCTPAACSLVVRDEGAGRSAGEGSGLGLRGLRDRLGLFGGSLTVRPSEGDGHTIEATIPYVTADIP